MASINTEAWANGASEAAIKEADSRAAKLEVELQALTLKKVELEQALGTSNAQEVGSCKLMSAACMLLLESFSKQSSKGHHPSKVHSGKGLASTFTDTKPKCIRCTVPLDSYSSPH